MFEIITIPDDAPLNYEQLGSRSKFWFLGEDGRHYLFKEGRPNTGENWSEKVASEFCELLGIPHALYELAVWRDLKGVISPNFVPDQGRLVHGNELLAKVSPYYDVTKKFRQRHHTLDTVLALVTCYQKTGAEEMLESPEREEIRGEEKAFFGRADHRDFAASRTG